VGRSDMSEGGEREGEKVRWVRGRRGIDRGKWRVRMFEGRGGVRGLMMCFMEEGGVELYGGSNDYLKGFSRGLMMLLSGIVYNYYTVSCKQMIW
jgi:hypothetical protein